MVTKVASEVLRAALKRDGIWFVDLEGTPTSFVHKTCWRKK